MGFDLSNLGGLVDAGKEKARLETMAIELGHEMPKGISFKVEDGHPEAAKPGAALPGTLPSGASIPAGLASFMAKPTKVFAAEITEDQKKHLTEVIGGLSKEEQAALQGNLKFNIESKDGKSFLVLEDAAKHVIMDIHNFNSEKNGSAKAIAAALNGDTEAAKAALAPLVKNPSTPLVPHDESVPLVPKAPDTKAAPAAPSAPSDGPPKPPTSDVGHEINFKKLEEAGFKVTASATQQTSGNGLEGVVAKPAPSREAGIA